MSNNDNMRGIDRAWVEIFRCYKIDLHDFSEKTFPISAKMIKKACQNFTKTSEKEARLLCKQDTRESRPQVFKDKGIFILPVRNGHYELVRGEGYIDIPPITSKVIEHPSALDFDLTTSAVGDSEMQHLDYAYAISMVRSFIGDDSLVLTIRGRKYTPEFSFKVGKFNITAKSVQTEVDSGYEGHDKVVLVEAKNNTAQNTIIRQLYYPYRQWKSYTEKDVFVVFFMHQENEYHFWQFEFSAKNNNNYNSICPLKSKRYRIKP